MSNPTIADAKAVAKKHGKDGIIIFHLDKSKGVFGYASYGRDRAQCQEMQDLADRMFDAAAGEEPKT
jgi:hypothetical protein